MSGVFSSFIFFLRLFIPINFIELEAMMNGMSVRLSSYLSAMFVRAVVQNSIDVTRTSIFERVIPDPMADKFEPYNLQAVIASSLEYLA
jgi:hypothetical protein